MLERDASSSPPIACTLPAEELMRRRDALLPGLLLRSEQLTDLENGLLLRFPPAPGLLTELAGIIEQEQVCCRFLRFQISIEPDAGAITLEVTGPPGTRDMLRGLGL